MSVTRPFLPWHMRRMMKPWRFLSQAVGADTNMTQAADFQ
jgi:hypothetical protein